VLSLRRLDLPGTVKVNRPYDETRKALTRGRTGHFSTKNWTSRNLYSNPNPSLNPSGEL